MRKPRTRPPVRPEGIGGMPGPSLYDMLLGHIGGEPLEAHDENTLEILSIMENLRRILNTRAGALAHLPDYGLPDLTEVYKALPASARQLQARIEHTVLRYEPRVRAVDIDLNDDGDPGMAVSFDMTCHARNAGLVRYGAHFDPGGRALLEWRRRQA
jgi:type VI secretion system protein